MNIQIALRFLDIILRVLKLEVSERWYGFLSGVPPFSFIVYRN
jgi:hypothetical protein